MTAPADPAPADPAPNVPHHDQRLTLPTDELAAFEAWGVEGTALTAAARVRDQDGRVALVRNRWSDGWLPPGGGVEVGESPREAAAREVREETGLDATVGEPLVVLDQTYVERESGAARFGARYVLYGATAEGEIPDSSALGVDTDEIADARWFDRLPENVHDGDLLRPYH